MPATEFNFDGLIGPTHNYAGLSFGNVASMSHRATISSPKAAALQGLAKMKRLADLGIPQAVLPPHERPHLPTLRRLGFTGDDAAILRAAHKSNPILLASICSASSMWAANAATVSPSIDSGDAKVHFTSANLISQFHRSIEADQTARILKKIFPESAGCFLHHPPLPGASHFADEGAANHLRVARQHGEIGTQIFVSGRRAFDAVASLTKFPARQTFEASNAIARLHQLQADRAIFVAQTSAAIDAGAFHNDVVAVANENVLLFHRDAFVDRDWIDRLRDDGLIAVESNMPLNDAVKSYAFNSQLVTLPDQSTRLIAPVEARDSKSASDFIDECLSRGAISGVEYVDVRQSMQNGGGPACLRLRVVLNDHERSQVHGGVMWSATLHDLLAAWIEKFYRDELRSEDLADPKLLRESRNGLDELTRILRLGSIYQFQSS